jgi:tRNA dimethylallyltransferase
VLHRRIERRFREMLEAGFEAEVRGLLAIRDLSPALPSMRAVGYRQMLKYVRGETTLGEMVAAGIAATRQLAKRQYTWLRRERHCHWLLDGADPLGRAAVLLGAHRSRGDAEA